MNNALILLVDDEELVREALSALLSEDYRLLMAHSGEAALALLDEPGAAVPDLILLDIEMQQLDGYETCRALRAAGHDMPVIFLSGHDNPEERLRAFDAGGDDFVSKPYDGEELRRKLRLAVGRKQRADGLQAVTRQILHEVGETGVLLAFLREAIRITEHERLADLLLKSVDSYGLRCYVQIRHEHGTVTLTPGGEPTSLELSILARATSLDHKFRMGRRMVINFHFCSVMVLDLPADSERSRRLLDYVDVLVESAEAVAETLDVRRESAARAEALMVASAGSFSAVEDLRERYRKQQADTRVLLQELIEGVEHTYVHLGLTENQEEIISSTMRHNAETILRLFEQSVEFERQFAALLDALRPQSNTAADVWL